MVWISPSTSSTLFAYWRLTASGVARGGLEGSNPPFASKPFFHSRKVTVINYYNLSLTTRRTINSHDLRKTNHWRGGGAIASMIECVLTWIREQYLVVCNIAKWTILCIFVHFQPVIKLLQKGVRVHHKRVILMQKCNFFLGGGHSPLPRPLPSGEGDTPSPHLTSPLRAFGASILTHPILKFCLRYCSLQNIQTAQHCLNRSLTAYFS